MRRIITTIVFATVLAGVAAAGTGLEGGEPSVGPGQSPRAEAIEGRVWLDANGNGHFDAGEQGVAGCLVSDGSQLVRTDASGHYRLEPCSAQAAVFVVNPSGTWPRERWWGSAGSSAAPGTIDFALQAQHQDGPLVFVQGTDIHLRPEAVTQYRRYVEHVNHLPLPVRFVIHTGDLVVDALPCDTAAAEKLFQLYEDETKAIRYPLRNLAGNHEHVGIARKDILDHDSDYGKGMYLRRLGPPSYAFRYGRYHFLVLDGTTLDPQAKNGYRDRLDDASVAWATRYLATVGPDEPLIVLVHQPLGSGDSDRLLLQALHGKRLLAVICGHEHGRALTRWGGAPMMVGGAVSYAWHGSQPFPPDPWGYVVYRLADAQLEYAYLDWAAERSVDLKSPAWRTIVTGPRLAVDGTVSDFDGGIRRIVCRLGGLQAEAQLTRTGHLVDHFEATIDCSHLADGVYDLAVEALDQSHTCCHARPLIVKRGQAEPLSNGRAKAAAEASPVRLALQVASSSPEGNEVRLNGQRLTRIPAAKEPSRQWSFDLPRDRLQRLNQITVVPGTQGSPELSRVRIEFAGESYGDIRFAPNMKRGAVKSGDNKGALDYFIDLTYRGPRGAR
jgi:hypothetical protein